MTEWIHCAGIDARLIHSARRKTIGISVRDGEVTVRAPKQGSLAEVKAFVSDKRSWIHAHLEKQQHALATAPADFCNGEDIRLLGRLLKLKLHHAAASSVYLDGTDLVAGSQHPENPRAVQKLIEAWYKKTALTFLSARIKYYSQLMNLQVREIKIRRYKTRWGSCTHDARLQFNWLLIMAPPEVVDYVVVHELAHMKHFDHSPRFWKLVESILPDYKLHKRWLREQTHLVWHSH